MGQPQSYKDLFKNIKQRKQVAAPIPPQILKTRTQEQAKAEAKLQKEFIKFANDQRCEVCGDQLDGPVYFNRASLYCVSNNDHFKSGYNQNKKLIDSYALYSFDVVEYEVFASARDDEYNVKIYQLDKHLTPQFRYRLSEKKKIFEYVGTRFEFPKGLSQKEFEQNIKLFITFS